MKVLIVGAGGHGQVVADILRAQEAAGAALHAIGYVDDAAGGERQQRLGLPVLGRVTEIARIEHDALLIAIGDNRQRSSMHKRLSTPGTRFATACHPSAILASDVTVGDGSMLCAQAFVGCGSRIGRGVILNTACTVDHHSSIGDFAHIGPGVHLGGEVFIGEGALLGVAAAVLPRVRIGQHAIVGAGAVVTRDVPAGATVVGVPADVIRSRAAG